MKHQNFFRIFIFYFFLLVFFSIIFFILIRLPIFKEENVLFYRGIILLFLTSLIYLFLGYLVRKKISFFLILNSLIFCLSLHLVFFVVFPVTFERSVTMFLLKTIAKNKEIRKSDLERILITDYIQKNQALEKRLEEQIKIDLLEVNNDRVKITEKGKKFLEISELIKKIYDVR